MLLFSYLATSVKNKLSVLSDLMIINAPLTIVVHSSKCVVAHYKCLISMLYCMYWFCTDGIVCIDIILTVLLCLMNSAMFLCNVPKRWRFR